MSNQHQECNSIRYATRHSEVHSFTRTNTKNFYIIKMALSYDNLMQVAVAMCTLFKKWLMSQFTCVVRRILRTLNTHPKEEEEEEDFAPHH